MRLVLITGITGQDGGYLAEQLAAEGAQVHGLVRPGDDAGARNVTAQVPGVALHTADLVDTAAVAGLVQEVHPDEVYNLAGISSVAYSWAEPLLTAQVTGVAVAGLLEAVWRYQEESERSVAVVQATSAEIFGDAQVSPQNESTPVRPVSPYGAAKAYAHHLAGVYRGRGLHVSSCILFNHESPRRPTTFVTRKITAAAARIAVTGQGVIALGNLAAQRDWGWAPDYVDAMVRAARHVPAGDYVISTGQVHTVAQFAEAALRHAGVGEEWRDHIQIDPQLLRPTDAAVLVGDASKARDELGWAPTLSFEELVARMVDHDIALLRAAR